MTNKGGRKDTEEYQKVHYLSRTLLDDTEVLGDQTFPSLRIYFNKNLEESTK